jgi:hypothetical protein
LFLNNDKVAALKLSYDLDIDEDSDCKNIIPIINKNRKITSVHIWTKIYSDSSNSIVECIVKKELSHILLNLETTISSQTKILNI